MAINERLVHTASAAAAAGGGNQEEGLILHLDANDVDSYDGDGTEWVDIANHEYKPATNVSEHFNTVLYIGNSGTNEITGVGFQPDLVWIKNRASGSHGWVDSMRGNDSVIFSNSTAAAASLTGGDLSMDTDGFDINTYSSSWANLSSNSYVAWCFKAGGAPTATNSGGQTPTSGSKMVDDVAVTDNYPSSDIYPNKQTINTKLGFSITNYTGNLSSTQTLANSQSIPHGLEQTPEMIIFKRTEGGSWNVRHKDIGNEHQVMFLNTTDGVTNYQSSYPIYPNDSSHFYTNWTTPSNISGSSHIAYSFISKRGVSKVGSYTGTGADGNKIYLGFEPAWIMFKGDATAGWIIHDNKRDTTNPRTPHLRANSNAAEDPGSNEEVDFHRDGFSVGGSGGNANSNGTKYIYLAFAKDTNETDLIDDTDLELHLDADSFDGSTNTPSTWTALTGSNATISGATFDSELGNYLNFDGSGDKVITAQTFNSTNDFTAELWVKRDTNGERLLFKSGGTHPNAYYLIFQPSLGFYYRDYSSGAITYTGLAAAPINEWLHVCVVNVFGSPPKIYVNGVHENASTTSGSSTGTSGTDPFKIGEQFTAALWYDWSGYIGQVRMYSSALTQDQVRQNFNFTKNDYPNGINGLLGSGTTNNMPSWDVTNGYFDFDGSNDWVRLTDNTTRSLNQSIVSYSLWVNLDQLKNYQWAFSIGSGQQIETYFAVYGNGAAQGAIRGARCIMDSTATEGDPGSFPTGQWVHIAMTVNSNNNAEIYKNGVLIDNSASHGTSEPSDTLMYKQFYIGARYNNSSSTGSDSGLASYYFDGKINKLKFYDRPLTSQEISDLNDEGYN